MSFDPSSIETDLRGLRATALDEALLARLERCASATWTELDPAELAEEHAFRSIAPAKLPSALMASLEAAVAGTPFVSEKKIVRFPQRETAAPRRNRGWWSAAAVVALSGAAAALLMPDSRHGGEVRTAGNTHQTSLAETPPLKGNLVPAGFNRGLSEASDEGVIWQENSQPHRVLKVVYKERVTLKDAAGRTYQVEQPRVEYILVPAKTN